MVISTQSVLRLKDLMLSPDSPMYGFCDLDDREFLTDMMSRLPEDALIVEVGTFKGKATAVMALACLDTSRRIVAVDPFVEYEHHSGNPASLALGLHQTWEGVYKDFLATFEEVPFVAHIRKTSERAAIEWDGGEIDFIWIDGSHKASMVKIDLELWVPFIKKGGIVSGHDWQFKPVRDGVGSYLIDKPHTLQIQGRLLVLLLLGAKRWGDL